MLWWSPMIPLKLRFSPGCCDILTDARNGVTAFLTSFMTFSKGELGNIRPLSAERKDKQ